MEGHERRREGGSPVEVAAATVLAAVPYQVASSVGGVQLPMPSYLSRETISVV